jgi:hypothetical protein
MHIPAVAAIERPGLNEELGFVLSLVDVAVELDNEVEVLDVVEVVEMLDVFELDGVAELLGDVVPVVSDVSFLI